MATYPEGRTWSAAVKAEDFYGLRALDPASPFSFDPPGCGTIEEVLDAAAKNFPTLRGTTVRVVRHLPGSRIGATLVSDKGTAAVPGCSCGGYHPANFQFYVSVIDGDRKGFLLGPYATHEEALANVERGQKLADKADPRAHWYAYGTCGTAGTLKTVFGK